MSVMIPLHFAKPAKSPPSRRETVAQIRAPSQAAVPAVSGKRTEVRGERSLRRRKQRDRGHAAGDVEAGVALDRKRLKGEGSPGAPEKDVGAQPRTGARFRAD